MTIEEYFERLDEREDRLMNINNYHLELITKERKIKPKYEAIVTSLPINQYFSIRRLAKSNEGIGEITLKKYINDWCFEKGYELFLYKGAKKGSIIKEVEQ